MFTVCSTIDLCVYKMTSIIYVQNRSIHVGTSSRNHSNNISVLTFEYYEYSENNENERYQNTDQPFSVSLPNRTASFKKYSIWKCQNDTNFGI